MGWVLYDTGRECNWEAEWLYLWSHDPEEIKEPENTNMPHLRMKCWWNVLQNVKDWITSRTEGGVLRGLDGAGKERRGEGTRGRKGRSLMGGEGGRARKSWTECPMAFLSQVSRCIIRSGVFTVRLYLFSSGLWIMEHTLRRSLVGGGEDTTNWRGINGRFSQWRGKYWNT